MTSRKRRTTTTTDEDTPIRPKREAVVETSSYICLLDPNRTLLRRVFLVNEERNKYISVAFYPQQGYAVLVELGATKFTNLSLSELQFTKVIEHVPALIEAICADEYYVSDVSDNFKVVIGSSYQTARFILGLGKNRKEIVLKLHELIYLNNILYLLINQVARYGEAAVDVASYSTSVMASTEFIEPQPHYNNQIQYSPLYDELKTIILIKSSHHSVYHFLHIECS
jgi:hypothetical protein